MRFRAATVSDWPKLVALDSVASDGPARSRQIEHWIAAGQCFVLEDEQPRAYAVLTRHFFDRPFIEMLMVDPAFRQQGFGAALVEHLTSVVADGEIWTSTNRSNEPMRRLLGRLDFEQRGEIDIDAGDPELIFCRRESSIAASNPFV